MTETDQCEFEYDLLCEGRLETALQVFLDFYNDDGGPESVSAFLQALQDWSDVIWQRGFSAGVNSEAH